MNKSLIGKAAPSARAYAVSSLGSILVFLLVMAALASIYALDITLYTRLLREDGFFETLTAIFFGLAALFAVCAFLRMPEALHWSRPFLVLFALFAVLATLEEISWGQRILDIKSSEFFEKHSDQKEINVHNVVQGYLRREGYIINRTRSIGAIVLFAYGVVLPILGAFPGPRALFRKFRIIIPPPALMPGFFLGSLFAWFDWPTGQEEEFGEFLFSLCFMLLVPLWWMQQRSEAYNAPS